MFMNDSPWAVSWTKAEVAELHALAQREGGGFEARLEFHDDGEITVHASSPREGREPLRFHHTITPTNLTDARRLIERYLTEARNTFQRVP
jgi:hypothetical protein